MLRPLLLIYQSLSSRCRSPTGRVASLRANVYRDTSSNASWLNSPRPRSSWKPVPLHTTGRARRANAVTHRIRQQWVATPTQRINLARGLLAEFGIVLPASAAGIVRRLHQIVASVPTTLVTALGLILEEINTLEHQIKQLDRQLTGIAQAHPDIQRLMTIPGSA